MLTFKTKIPILLITIAAITAGLFGTVQTAHGAPSPINTDYVKVKIGDYAYEKGGELPSSPSDYDYEATNEDYEALGASDDNRWSTDLATASTSYNTQIFQFTLDEQPSEIGDIDINWEGYIATSSATPICLKAYNYTNATWTVVADLYSSTTNDEDLKGSLTGDMNNYLDSANTFSVLAAPHCPCGVYDITFTYDGEEVTYGTVSYAGECWLDRNLGATTTASALDDSSGYGDLYQWGRCQDGHEFRYSATTSQLATTTDCGPNAGHPWDGKFIPNDSSPNDWLETQDDSLWASSTNKNDPCPDGWRVPTESEWASTSDGWATSGDAIASPLKLPAGGVRFHSDGDLANISTHGYYWSSTASSTEAIQLYFYDTDVAFGSAYRTGGRSVRCLRD